MMHGRRGFSNRSRNSRTETSFAEIRGTSSPKFAVDNTSGLNAYPFLDHSPPETLSSLRVARLAARMRFSHRSTGESFASLVSSSSRSPFESSFVVLLFLPCLASFLDLSRAAVAASAAESAADFFSGTPADFAWGTKSMGAASPAACAAENAAAVMSLSRAVRSWGRATSTTSVGRLDHPSAPPPPEMRRGRFAIVTSNFALRRGVERSEKRSPKATTGRSRAFQPPRPRH